MLVLTRKYQEKIRIGDGITITILRAKGKAVRLGIEAPPNVPVIRGELSFNQDSATATDAVPAASSAPAVAVVPSTADRRSRQGRVQQNWSSDSHPASQRRERVPAASSAVSMHRIPREKKTEILPQLLGGEGPLRRMMGDRARAV